MIIDLHAHSRPRSDDSDLSPVELILQAKQAGLDAICVTEHDWHWEEEEVSRLSRDLDFLVFRGMEISSDEGHVLVFGLGEYRFGMHHAGFIRKLVDEAGGVMIMAHPYRRQVHYNAAPQELLEVACDNRVFQLVDAVETLNGRSNDRENEFALELSRRLDLKGVGGSDAHSFADIPTCATEFEREISTLEELMTELKAGRYWAVDLR